VEKVGHVLETRQLGDPWTSTINEKGFFRSDRIENQVWKDIHGQGKRVTKAVFLNAPGKIGSSCGSWKTIVIEVGAHSKNREVPAFRRRGR